MKILVKGDPNKRYNPIRFECDRCGCVFEADNTEYKSGSQYNDVYHYCACPTCGKSCYTYQK